jgi:hypothetical protein
MTGKLYMVFKCKRLVQKENECQPSWSDRDHYSTSAILLNPLVSHCLPLNNSTRVNFAIPNCSKHLCCFSEAKVLKNDNKTLDNCVVVR